MLQIRHICLRFSPNSSASSATTMVNDMKVANTPAVMIEHSHKTALTHGLNGPYSLMGEAALCSRSHAAALQENVWIRPPSLE